jgi:site-specific DNA-methyltransferase (adenine-specific)
VLLNWSADGRATLPGGEGHLGEDVGDDGELVLAPGLGVPSVKRLAPAIATNHGVVYATDCFNLFAALKSDSIDCVFADPPFNLKKDYGGGAIRDDLAKRDYLKWCFAWIDECVRLLRPGGALFIYILPQWGYHLAAHIEERGMLFRHWIAMSMKGTFPRGYKLYPAHYGLLYFTKGQPKTFNRVRLPIPTCRHCGKDVKDYGGHRKYLNPFGLNLTDFWDDTAPARHQKFKTRSHINELKPMIPGRCIEVATQKGDIVLDPFGGGGSTYEAAEQRGRYWLGAEITTASTIRERFQRRFPGTGREFPEPLSRIFVDPDPRFRIAVH